MKKHVFLIVTAIMICLDTSAQTIHEAKSVPGADEKVIGSLSEKYDAGEISVYQGDYRKRNRDSDKRIILSDEDLLAKLITKASNMYGNTYPMFKLRNFKVRMSEERTYYEPDYLICHRRYYYVSASVVVPSHMVMVNSLPQAIERALKNIKEGARLAISQLSVSEDIDEESYKDRIIDVLLDKGYRVVAKEYLQKLYEEQQQQGSGVYNDTTTAQRNNFSAAGYYLNIKVTKNSLRVQVINVSTGEYEGNETVNF